jgi:hypothetical protein
MPSDRAVARIEQTEAAASALAKLPPETIGMLPAMAAVAEALRSLQQTHDDVSINVSVKPDGSVDLTMRSYRYRKAD